MKLNVIITVLVLFSLKANLAAATPSNTYGSTLRSQPKIGVSVEPIWLVLGGLGAKADYFLTDRISIGVNGFYIPGHQNKKSENESAVSQESYIFSANEINFGSNFMLTGTLSSDGVYINPAVGYQNTKISEYGESKLEGSLSGPQARLTAGYQWVNQHNKLRIAVGGGLRVVQSGDVVIKDKSGTEVLRQSSSSLGGLAIDAQVGFLF